MAFTSFIAIGFLLGLRHATDADHVLAVSTIVTRERSVRAAMWLGLLWGAGHTLTLTMVGALLLLFGVVIPVQVSLALEGLVALMLIGLGVWVLRGAYRATQATPLDVRHLREHEQGTTTQQVERSHRYVEVERRARSQAGARKHMHRHGGGNEHMHTHVGADKHRHTHVGADKHMHTHVGANKHMHTHVHGDYVHTHAHGHTAASHGHPPERTPAHWLDRRFGGWPWYQWARPVVIGVVHGLAGSAAVVLLVMASTRDVATALLYLVAFGLGTLAGMAALTSAMAAPLALAARRMPRFGQRVRLLAGTASIVFGVFMIAQIGAASQWWFSAPALTPHGAGH
jgi:high-affinity nickel-transport protein